MTFDKEKILEYCNRISKNTLMETLNIEYVDAGEGFFAAKCQLINSSSTYGTLQRCLGGIGRKCR
jgi:hypothetical protein